MFFLIVSVKNSSHKESSIEDLINPIKALNGSATFLLWFPSVSLFVQVYGRTNPTKKTRWRLA